MRGARGDDGAAPAALLLRAQLLRVGAQAGSGLHVLLHVRAVAQRLLHAGRVPYMRRGLLFSHRISELVKARRRASAFAILGVNCRKVWYLTAGRKESMRGPSWKLIAQPCRPDRIYVQLASLDAHNAKGAPESMPCIASGDVSSCFRRGLPSSMPASPGFAAMTPLHQQKNHWRRSGAQQAQMHYVVSS